MPTDLQVRKNEFLGKKPMIDLELSPATKLDGWYNKNGFVLCGWRESLPNEESWIKRLILESIRGRGYY